MTETTSIRQEMHRLIDLMPESELLKLRVSIHAPRDERDSDELTPSEKRTVKRNLERFREHPEEFVSWKKLKNA